MVLAPRIPPSPAMSPNRTPKTAPKTTLEITAMPSPPSDGLALSATWMGTPTIVPRK